ncbi:Rieske (2Fe-2S) protein [Streptomyces chryseus]|uniref:Rieske (2Fe-2S) protein n=1 Tax=Streptomyces chryseus TaxID=68186 RepID=UPI00110FDA6C|nr:Rieske (2Fe-2S) protein [Streptomyces chryseus]GGW91840.1 iron-sulfur protein [Streptomyces chryseus]
MGEGTSRRAVLTAGAAAAGTALTVGCGSGGDGGDETRPATPESPARSGQSPTSGGTPTAGETPAGGRALAETSEIPVGGGKIFADQKVVVTQPEEGTFKGFSAICTHQGCTVGSVEDGTINCPCHGSKFRVTDASVAAGPARKPLPPREITVESGSIRLP